MYPETLEDAHAKIKALNVELEQTREDLDEAETELAVEEDRKGFSWGRVITIVSGSFAGTLLWFMCASLLGCPTILELARQHARQVERLELVKERDQALARCTASQPRADLDQKIGMVWQAAPKTEDHQVGLGWNSGTVPAWWKSGEPSIEDVRKQAGVGDGNRTGLSLNCSYVGTTCTVNDLYWTKQEMELLHWVCTGEGPKFRFYCPDGHAL